ncbi:SDR family NAD(P)-dependent oxidoreductase [Alicyclobacillus acidiphilus]|uniref:SDR family NAD(P)-dependent oxidoreductase n=1 Tax=Alicyclobacillus acidiphilus TaxID=182455 RepID=UPI000835490D|nr:SDR family NAD(P)-dependent oxidoreductase [Alicyclobacillus acidiphilus]
MVVLVVGASRGLGYALTSELLRRGNTVVAACRSIESSSRLTALQMDSGIRNLHVIEMDVGNEAAVMDGAKYVSSTVGRIDAIINNAAIFVGHDQDIRDLDLGQVLRSFDINTLGPARVVKHFVPLMSGSGSRTILNISSEAGSITTCGKNGYGYSLSKAALNMFSQILGHNLSEAGIRVMAVHPGRMRTDMGRPDFPDSAEEAASAISDLLHWEGDDQLEVRFIDRFGNPMPL